MKRRQFWYDESDDRLVAAAARYAEFEQEQAIAWDWIRLNHKVIFPGVFRFNLPLWSIIAVSLTLAATQQWAGLLVFGVLLAVYVSIFGEQWIVARCKAMLLLNALERGDYGMSVMVRGSIEWKTLDKALHDIGYTVDSLLDSPAVPQAAKVKSLDRYLVLSGRFRRSIREMGRRGPGQYQTDPWYELARRATRAAETIGQASP